MVAYLMVCVIVAILGLAAAIAVTSRNIALRRERERRRAMSRQDPGELLAEKIRRLEAELEEEEGN